MDNKKIQLILQDVLEEEIPSSQIQLWSAVKASLVVGNQQILQQGEKMNTTKTFRMPRFALAVLIIVVLLVVALITPQGRSFAQSVLQLFIPAESTIVPLQPSQIITDDPNLVVPTSPPPAPLISIMEAETQVGFEIAELPFVPDGFNYLGARLYGNLVSIEYETSDQGGHLTIQQSPTGYNQSNWDQVPEEMIIPVQIGDLDGEFVQGTFIVYPGENSATWNPEVAMLRLRWVDDGIWFQIKKTGDVEAIEYLDRVELIKLAESLSIQP